MPFSLASSIKGKWIFSQGLCTLSAWLILALLGVSLMTMSCTATIHHFCVVKPSLYQKYVKTKTVARGISLLWLIYCVLQAFLLSYGHGEYSKRRTCCRYDTDKFDGKEIVAIKLNYINLALIFAHCSLIFLAYFKVFRFVSHHNHAVADSLQQPANHSHIEEAKITKTVAVVVFGVSVLLCSSYNHAIHFCCWWL